MGYNSAVSGHLISMSFPQVDGWSMDPRVLGVTLTILLVLSLSTLFVKYYVSCDSPRCDNPDCFTPILSTLCD